MSALVIIAGIFAGVAVFAFCLGILHKSDWLLTVGAACLAGFVTTLLGWVAALVQGAR